MENVVKVLGYTVLWVLVIVGVSILLAYPTMWMVNYLFTSELLTWAFGVEKITVWQALWLNALCATLFKSSTSSK